MKPVGIAAAVAASLVAAACSQAPAGPSANGANAAAPATNAAAPNSIASAPAGPLSAYVGKLTSDVVGGSNFVARPEVRGAVESLVPDAAARRWILNPDTTQSPIAMRGGKLYSGACEPHNCGPHQWSILIAPDGTGAEICYHDDAQDPAHSHWYAAGRPPETRAGYCTPS